MRACVVYFQLRQIFKTKARIPILPFVIVPVGGLYCLCAVETRPVFATKNQLCD